MYRQVQHVRNTLGQLDSVLREAILADDLPAMVRLGTDGMAMIDQVIQALRRGAGEHDPGEPRVNQSMVDAAQRQLSLAWNRIEALALASDARGARAALLDSKTSVDLAAAYVAGALGEEFQI
ncbi:MAG TPA: hypothetical protein VFB58_00955 [Chloroflexota bacterium]|nr:hypothetical protein [Chloroflexota bacterium]